MKFLFSLQGSCSSVTQIQDIEGVFGDFSFVLPAGRLLAGLRRSPGRADPAPSHAEGPRADLVITATETKRNNTALGPGF